MTIKRKMIFFALTLFLLILAISTGFYIKNSYFKEKPRNKELFVCNESLNRISVLDPHTNSDVRLLRRIDNKTSLSLPIGIAVDPLNNEVYVANMGDSSIKVYDRNAGVDSAPIRIIEGKNTGLFGPMGIAVDTANNEIFVTNQGNNTITVYPRVANGNMSPARTITNESSGFILPIDVYIDYANNELIVAYSYTKKGQALEDGGAIVVYDRKAVGNSTYLRLINGKSCRLGNPRAVTLDSVNNELIVVNSSPSQPPVVVYPRTAKGDVIPTRFMTRIQQTIALSSIAVNAEENQLYLTGREFGSNTYKPAVLTCERTASGDVTPLKMSSIPSESSQYNARIVFDSVNKEILVSRPDNHSIEIYGTGAIDQTSPRRVIKAGGSGLNKPHGIAIDNIHGEIFVTNIGNNSIAVYKKSSEGYIEPVRVISGKLTGLNYPLGVAVNVNRNEIYVTNSESNSITVYSRISNGDVAPLRMISGINTGLHSPSGIAIYPERNEIIVANYEYDTVNNASADTITIYPITSNGDIPPLRNITGNNEAMVAGGIALDLKHDNIYLTNLVPEGDVLEGPGQSYISVYSKTEIGAEVKQRKIQAMNLEWGIAFDSDNDELFFVRGGIFGAIEVYSNGDGKERTISPKYTGYAPKDTALSTAFGMNSIAGVAID